MIRALALWVGFLLTFVSGFVIGSALQAKHDAKRFRQIGDALRDAALRKLLKFPSAEDLLAREKRPTLNIVKGFDDDD